MKIEELYSEESKRYDTRKVLNRAGHAKIDPSFFDMLSKEGLTSEYLESFPYPVYRYMTQITLHGVFKPTDINLLMVGGYQNVIVNQNKTIGIKYNAIDYEKKKRIGRYLKPYGYEYFRDSSGDDYSKSFIHKEEVLRAYRGIDVSQFLATKYVMYNPFTGRFYLRISLKAIYEREIWSFLTAVTGQTRQQIEASYEQAQAEDRRKQANYEQQAAANRIEAQARKGQLADTLKREYEPQLAGLPMWDGKFKEGLTVVRATGIGYRDEPGFRMYTLQKKGGWFQAVKGEFGELSKRPKLEFVMKSDKVTERTEKELYDRLSNKGKIQWHVLTGKPVLAPPKARIRLWDNYNYYLSQLRRL